MIDGTGCSGDVVIPDGVTKIGNAAFQDCAGLTNITLPDSVSSICLWAFKRCTGLTDIKLPDSLTILGEDVFLGCEGIAITYKGHTYSYDELSELSAAVCAAMK